jgi:hypothetical protein
MTVAGDSRDRAIELARRMEESRRFSQTNIVSERSERSTTGDTELFDIAAYYIPETLSASAAPPKTEATTTATIPKADVKSKKQEKPKATTPKGANP